MSDASNMSVPAWVETLSVEDGALERLVAGSFPPPLGELTDTLVALDEWLAWIETTRAQQAVGELLTYAESRWGAWLPTAPGEVFEIADAWRAIARLAEVSPRAGALRDFFRSRLQSDGAYLRSLTVFPSYDPFAAALSAAAVEQQDRHLAHFWWRFVDPATGEDPRYQAQGVLGLLAMPGVSGSRGLFDGELGVAALVAAARAARVGSDELGMPASRAQQVADLARVARMRYPRWAWWAPHFAAVDLDASILALLEAGFPEFASLQPTRPARDVPRPKRAAPPDRAGEWKQRSLELRGRLQSDPDGYLPVAEALLGEQRTHAETSGEAHPLVQTLCNLSTPMRGARPEIARRWAEEALCWEPWNPYPWSELITALEKQQDRAGAIEQGFRAIERVPYDDRLWYDLSNALRRAGCVELSAEVGWGALQRFDSALGLKALMVAYRTAGRPDLAITAAEHPYDDTDRSKTRDIWSQWIGAHVDLGERELAQAAWEDARNKGFRFAPLDGWEPWVPYESRKMSVPTDDEVACRAQARFLRLAQEREGWDRAVCHKTATRLIESAARFASGRGESDRVVAETALLIASGGEPEEAAATVANGLKRSPGSSVLWQVSGALAVDHARSTGRPFSRDALAELSAPYEQLVDRRAVAAPVAQIGVARAALSLVDGRQADLAAEATYAVVRSWHRDVPARSGADAEPNAGDPAELWKITAARALFGDSADRPVDAVRIHAASNATLLTDLETTYELQYDA